MSRIPIRTRPVRSAIFGYGSIGPVHLTSVFGSEDGVVSPIPDVSLLAVAEPDPERAAKVPDGVATVPNYQTALAELELDVVHVCLAHNLHAPATIAAAEKGVSIICEKPMALDAAEARSMRDAVNANGVGFSLISQNRLNPEKVWLKQQIAEGNLGVLESMNWVVDWFRSADYYANGTGWRGRDTGARGGVLSNQAYHTLDMVMWLTNSPVVEVNAESSVDRELHPDNDVPDRIQGSLTFANGVEAEFLATVCGDRNDVITIDALGALDGAKRRVKVDGSSVMEQNVVDAAPVFQDSGAELGGKACYGNSHQENIARSYEAFMEGTPVPVNAETGIRVLEVIDAILQSNGSPVRLSS